MSFRLSARVSVREKMGFFFTTALWILLGVFFMIAGGEKLLGQEVQIDSFFRWGYSLWFFYLVGAAELAGGIGLFISHVRFIAALVLSLTMVGAFITHLRSGEMAAVPIPLVLLCFLLILAWRVRPSTGTDRSRPDSF